MCILKGSEHKAEAEAYINFLCRTDVAKANAEYIGYSTPQTEARKQLDPEAVSYTHLGEMETLCIFWFLQYNTLCVIRFLEIKEGPR